MSPVVMGSAYRGITANPNSLGQLAAQSAITSFVLFLITYKSRTKLTTMFLGAVFSVSMLFVLFSFSRTSFFISIGISLLIILIFIKVFSIKIIKVIGLFLFLIVSYVFGFSEIFETGVLSRVNRLSEADNVLNNRDIIWERVFNEATILGHGSDYFVETIQIGAHNTVISILGQNGILAGAMFSVFLILILLKSLKYLFRHKKDLYSLVPFVIIAAFIIFSVFEGMIRKGIAFTFFNLAGVCIFYKKQN